MKVPNRLQKRVYDDFQEIKSFEGRKLTSEEQIKINSLKGRVQASENIEPGKFPEIKRLTNVIAKE